MDYRILEANNGTFFIRESNNKQLCEYIHDAQTAKLICATMSQCEAVNPSNPLAVAQNIKAMYDTLCKVASAPDVNYQIRQVVKKVLSTIESKEAK